MTPRLPVAGLVVMLSTVACTQGRSRQDSYEPPPPPQYSADEIGAMFERPSTLAQLLYNVKIGVDRGFLAQPGFGTDANLLKFFDGTAVRREPVASNIARIDQEDAFVSVDESHFPQMNVRVRLGLLREQALQLPTGRLPGRLRHFAEITMEVVAIPEFTARIIRNVFGKETEFHIGVTVSDGGTYEGSGAKGNLVYLYSDEPVRMLMPGEHRQVIFVIKKPPPPPNAFLAVPFRPDRQINDTDEVTEVVTYVPEP